MLYLAIENGKDNGDSMIIDDMTDEEYEIREEAISRGCSESFLDDILSAYPRNRNSYFHFIDHVSNFIEDNEFYEGVWEAATEEYPDMTLPEYLNMELVEMCKMCVAEGDHPMQRRDFDISDFDDFYMYFYNTALIPVERCLYLKISDADSRRIINNTVQCNVDIAEKLIQKSYMSLHEKEKMCTDVRALGEDVKKYAYDHITSLRQAFNREFPGHFDWDTFRYE